MNLIKYFKFYYSLTGGRIILLFIIDIIAAGAQMGAAGAIISVLQIGTSGDNFFTRTVFAVVSYLGYEGDKEILGVLLLFAVLAFFTSGILLMGSMLFVAKLQAEILMELQPGAVKRLVNSKFEYFLTQNIGYLNNVIVSQVRVVAQSFKLYADITLSIFFAASYLLIAFLVNPLLSLIMMLFGLPLLVLVKLINRKSREISVDNVNEYSGLNAIIIQMISNLKYLKSTETYPAVVEKLMQSSRRIAHLIVRLAFWSGLSSYGVTPFAVAFIAALIYWQVVFMGVPVIVAVSTLAFLYAAAQKFIAIPSSYQKFLSSAGAIIIYEDLDKALISNQEPPSDSLSKPDFGGKMEFRDVKFAYSSGKEAVLKDVSLEIPPCSSVAFVGGSGAGKSTLVNLITGILRPVSGEIALGGVEYGKMNLRELRRGIGYVTQESVIFNDTVANNISLWCSDGGTSKVVDAAKLSHAHGFIEDMPKKYETVLGDSGLNISGGQRQRISIAREFFRDPPIMILDEATSSMDSETEQFIHESIEKYHGRKTLIIIAHRLSTIKSCDIIYVLDKGYVVESGTYDELYRRGGKFRQMVDRQSLGEA